MPVALRKSSYRTFPSSIPGRRVTPTRRRAELADAISDLSYDVQGEGRDLVLLHGLGDSRRTWRKVAPLLAEHYRVWTPDLPGHGLSGRPDAPYTLDWFARSVLDWMDRVGIYHAHVCGHSFGGGVAQWLLMTQPERVNRLALVAAGGLGKEVTLGLRLAALPGMDRLFTPLAMRLGSLVAVATNRPTFGYPGLAEMWEYARINGLPGSGMAFHRTVRGVINLFGQHMQTRQGVEAVRILPPMALFWGERDPVIPPHHGRSALELFAGATLSLYPHCGHCPHLEAPARFVSELLQFLSDPARLPVRLKLAQRESLGDAAALAAMMTAG